MKAHTPLEEVLVTLERSTRQSWSAVDTFGRKSCMESFPALTQVLKNPASRAYLTESVAVTQLGQEVRVCWGRGSNDVVITNNLSDAMSILEQRLGVRKNITREAHQQLLEATAPQPVRHNETSSNELTRLNETVVQVIGKPQEKRFVTGLTETAYDSVNTSKKSVVSEATFQPPDVTAVSYMRGQFDAAIERLVRINDDMKTDIKNLERWLKVNELAPDNVYAKWEDYLSSLEDWQSDVKNMTEHLKGLKAYKFGK